MLFLGVGIESQSFDWDFFGIVGPFSLFTNRTFLELYYFSCENDSGGSKRLLDFDWHLIQFLIRMLMCFLNGLIGIKKGFFHKIEIIFREIEKRVLNLNFVNY